MKELDIVRIEMRGKIRPAVPGSEVLPPKKFEAHDELNREQKESKDKSGRPGNSDHDTNAVSTTIFCSFGHDTFGATR